MKALCASVFIIAASALTLNGEDLLVRAKELANGVPAYNIDKINKGNVRETKYPGERYTHILKSDITGTGRGVVRRKISWFNTEKRIHLHHTSDAVITEEILSSEKELNDGIIISKFTILHFSEKIGSAKSAITIGQLKCEDAAKLLKELGKKYHDVLQTTAKGLIAGGLMALQASLIPGPHQVATAPASVAAIPAGLAIHFLDWFLNKKLPEITDPDGFYKLDDKDVKARFPEYESIVAKIRHLEGSEIEAVWQYDIGYTKIDLKNAPPEITEEEITEEDKDLIAKMIYRMNPICARTIFPANNKDKRRWSIDAGDIGGMVLGTGIDYNNLTGSIHILNRGSGTRHWKDEEELGRSSVPINRIDIDTYWSNKINFSKIFKDKSKLNVGLIPAKGHMTIVLDDGGKKSPVYVRELYIEGKMDSRLKKEPKSLLAIVEFDEANLKMQCSYVQHRERPKQTIEEMKQEIIKKSKK